MPKLKEKILEPEDKEDPFDLPADVRKQLDKLDSDLKNFIDTQKKSSRQAKTFSSCPPTTGRRRTRKSSRN